MKILKYLLCWLVAIGLFIVAIKVLDHRYMRSSGNLEMDARTSSIVVLREELEKVKVQPKNVEEWTQEDEVKSSVVYYTEYKDDANNTLAYLTVGGTNDVRLLVTDPETLRKVNTVELNVSDYTITPGTGVGTATYDGKTVYNFFNNETPSAATTRSIVFNSTKYQPMSLKNPYMITSRSVGGGSLVTTNYNVDISYNNGSMTVSYTDGSDMDPRPSINYAYLIYDHVRGTEIPIAKVVDNLTHSDYFFQDTEGDDVSLGTLRRWIKNRYDDDTGSYWSTKPALQEVNLANFGMVYDSNNKFWTRYWEYSSTNKVLQWIMNGLVAWEFKMGEFGSDPENFQIRQIGWENDYQEFCVYFDADYGTEPYVVTCDNLKTTLWFRPDQTIDYNTTYDINGRTCYKSVIRLDVGKTEGFYQARTHLPGLPSAVIKTKVPFIAEDNVYLKDADGVTWKLGIMTNGALTTQQVDVE